MPEMNHPDYPEESENLQYTKKYVEKALQKTIEEKESIDQKVDYGFKHANSEGSQDYIDLLVNTRIQGYQAIRVKNLTKAVDKPYFSRIDFQEDTSDVLEKLYIGKVSLAREEDQKILIVDWRAPISNLYYEGRLGDAAYICPDGSIEGKLSLKRQFTIDEGKLLNIFDIDITTNDELLQSCLGANADNRLKDIVSTIQEEQNRIVRANMWKPLIVQGAAGSGKTTIALHRIAYLVYTFDKTFDPESFMIIAPNKLFLNYISEVLPELGVDRVKQTTFKDFAMDLLRKKFKIQDENEKLVSFSNSERTPEQKAVDERLKKCSRLKCSMEFKEIIDRYIAKVEKSYIPKQDFRIGRTVVYSYEEINGLFLVEYQRWPFAQRIDEIKKHLTTGLEKKKQQMKAEIQHKGFEFLQKVKNSSKNPEEKQSLIQRLYQRQEEAIAELEQKVKKAVREYVKLIEKPDPAEYYKDCIRTIVEDASPQDGFYAILPFLKETSEKLFSKGFIELEDLAPMIYLKYRIYGMDEKIPVKHIIIDEAQDFSAFQIYVLRKIIKDSSFTILGDICQGIHSYRGVHSWDDIKQNVFEEKDCEILMLEKSYRTTVEIMEAANRVIDHLHQDSIPKGQPVIRHGEPAKILKQKNTRETVEKIKHILHTEIGQQFKSAAVICKTLEECQKVYDAVRKDIQDIHMITGKEDEYKSGVVIVPSYLSKGLEFDIVILSNANSAHYQEDELDIKLLYVSMTRPLHKLFILYEGELSPLLHEVQYGDVCRVLS
ncbi:MAG: AAA family ATPase [Thermoclostridium sp.]|nr:AAA family ATPase [Thermoclostridium sp.]